MPRILHRTGTNATWRFTPTRVASSWSLTDSGTATSGANAWSPHFELSEDLAPDCISKLCDSSFTHSNIKPSSKNRFEAVLSFIWFITMEVYRDLFWESNICMNAVIALSMVGDTSSHRCKNPCSFLVFAKFIA